MRVCVRDRHDRRRALFKRCTGERGLRSVEEQVGLIVGHGRGGSAREEGGGTERERTGRSVDCRNVTGTVIAYIK